MQVIGFATHNRAGEIVYKHLGGTSFTYQIDVITYSEEGSPADKDSIQLSIWFCGNEDPIGTITVQRAVKESFENGIQKNIYRVPTYTFPGLGCFWITIADPNRIEAIRNIPNSIQIPFTLIDTLQLLDPTFNDFNNSPVLLQPPIDYAFSGFPFTHNPAAFDPDGDSLVYSLIPPYADPKNPVNGYTSPDAPQHELRKPNTLTIDRFTGQLTWENAQAIGTYNVAILIEEFRDGKKIGSQMRDMQIIVTDLNNEPPILNAILDTCVYAGDTLRIPISVKENDPNQVVRMRGFGLPFQNGDADLNPKLFNSVLDDTTFLEWVVNCDYSQRSKYILSIKAEDDFTVSGTPFYGTATHAIAITVLPPPILIDSVKTMGSGNAVFIQENYPCILANKLNSYSVYRKESCDTLTLPCFNSSDLIGFSRVLTFDFYPSPVFGTSPIIDETAENGVEYTYVVVAEFSDTTIVGLPIQAFTSSTSSRKCIITSKNMPYITQVDVTRTGAINGAIQVAWQNPVFSKLDTNLHPFPYQYQLMQNSGLMVYAYSSEDSLNLNKNEFEIEGINTRQRQFTYQVLLRDANDNIITKSELATSSFLSLNQIPNQVQLNWTLNYPWNSDSSRVLRDVVEFSEGGQDLGVTQTDRFFDTEINKENQLCYLIVNYGSYSSPEIDGLVNRSQSVCVSIDTLFNKCPPKLTVRNFCNPLGESIPEENADINFLNWDYPDSCALISDFIIYVGNSSTLIDEEVGTSVNNVFEHTAGSGSEVCYQVAARYPDNTIGPKSNVFCTEICPDYTLPNTFSPNGDGIYDIYTPQLPFSLVSRVDFKVFDQYGNLVYQTDNPMINWDGTSASGKPMPVGAYFYQCRIYGQGFVGEVELDQLKGYINLLR